MSTYLDLLNQHNISAAEIALLDRVVAIGEDLRKLHFDIAAHFTQPDTATSGSADPWGWLEAGRNDLQDGLMKLARSVAQPEFF